MVLKFDVQGVRSEEVSDGVNIMRGGDDGVDAFGPLCDKLRQMLKVQV